MKKITAFMRPLCGRRAACLNAREVTRRRNVGDALIR